MSAYRLRSRAPMYSSERSDSIVNLERIAEVNKDFEAQSNFSGTADFCVIARL